MVSLLWSLVGSLLCFYQRNQETTELEYLFLLFSSVESSVVTSHHVPDAVAKATLF